MSTEESSGKLSGNGTPSEEGSAQNEQIKGVSKKEKVAKKKESEYTGFGLNPFPLLICVNVCVLAVGIALLVRAYDDPSLRGST